MRNLHITYRPITELEPFDRNARTHSNKHVRQIAGSIVTFGWTNPILIDTEGGIVDYLRNTPNFETASGKYDWLNRIVAVGVGRRRSDHAAYEVFQIL